MSVTMHASPSPTPLPPTRPDAVAGETAGATTTPRPPHGRAGGAVLNVFSHGILLTWAAMVVLPLLWCVLSAFKSDDELLTSAWSLPARARWENFAHAWLQAEIGRYFLNTVIVVCLGTLLTLGMGSTVAYVVSRYTFRGNRLVYFLFIAGLTFPVFLAIVPLFFVAHNLGLADSLVGLGIIYGAHGLPFSVFFLTAYFKTLSTSYVEAAFVDGCGHWGAYLRIMLPLARPGLVSVGIFTVLGQWNQYLLPLVLQTSPDKYVLTQGLRNLSISEGYAGNWSVLFAGLTISMLPVLAVYLVFQRQIQSGLVVGALK